MLGSHGRSHSLCSSPRVRSPCLTYVTAVLLVVRLVAVVMQSHAVELFERIRNFVSRCREAGVQRYALQLVCTAVSDVDTVGLLHVTEVESVDTAALVGDDRRLRVAEKSP